MVQAVPFIFEWTDLWETEKTTSPQLHLIPSILIQHFGPYIAQTLPVSRVISIYQQTIATPVVIFLLLS